MDIWSAVIFTIKDTGNGSMLCVREDSGMQLASWPWAYTYVMHMGSGGRRWEKDKKTSCRIIQ